MFCSANMALIEAIENNVHFTQRSEQCNNYTQNCCWVKYHNTSGIVQMETGYCNEYGSTWGNGDLWVGHLCDLPISIRQIILSY